MTPRQPIDDPRSILAVMHDFVRRQGLTGALLVVVAGMIWFDRQDRIASLEMSRAESLELASFVRDSTAATQQFAYVLQAHIDETKEHDHDVLLILRALCVNAAETPDARARCVGR